MAPAQWRSGKNRAYTESGVPLRGKAPGSMGFTWSAFKSGRRRKRERLDRLLAVAVGGFSLLIWVNATHAAALHLRCTNPVSGTSWPVVVDLDHQRVDSFPAEISDKWISWHDPAQGFFDLERTTGKLEMRNASSTGGYFLHYVCRAE